MLSRSEIKKAAAAFVGAVTMAVALPTALYANITVKADEPSELPVITQSTVTTTTLPASVYNSDLFKSYYSVSDTVLVGSTIELETNSAPGVMFPDNMTFVEDGEVREVKAEKLDNGKRKWKGNFIEFTVEKDSSVAVVTVLKKGMTDCLIGWGEENGYDDNKLYPYNTFLHVDAMEKAEYEAYLEDLDRPYPTVQPTTAIGAKDGDEQSAQGDPAEEYYYPYDYREEVGLPDVWFYYVGQTLPFEVKDPSVDLTFTFEDTINKFDGATEESDTSRYIDVKSLGGGKFELTAKAEGHTVMWIGADKKRYVNIDVRQASLSGNFGLPYLYSDGTDDEKTLIYDLADYFTDYDEQGEMFHRDIDDIVSVESVAYTDVLKMKKNPVPVASIEPTDKKGVYKIKALEPGCEFIYFIDKNGIKWEMWIIVTSHSAEAAAEEYRRTHPTSVAGTLPYVGNTASTVMGDVNNDNDITLADSLAILQHLANENKYGLTGQMLLNADIVDRGEGVTPQDALAIQKIDAKVLSISALPVKSSQL